MLGCVYLVRNSANGSIYIGKALVGVEKRRAQHFNAARRGEEWAFYRAVRVHGEDAFSEWLVLFSSDDDAALIEAECSLIADYRAAGARLYNNTDGGVGSAGRKVKPQTRARMRAKALGRRLSDDHRESISRAGRGAIRTQAFKENLAEKKRQYWADRRAAGLSGHARVMTEEGRRKLSENAAARWEKWKAGDKACIGKPSR
jgi:hypothetical protein